MRLFLTFVCCTALIMNPAVRAEQDANMLAVHPNDRDMIIIPPNLPQIHGVKIRPQGVELLPQEFAPGVFGLISTRKPVDNSGVIIGEDSILVVDAHINEDMAGKILANVKTLTGRDAPDYLFNTNYHGDHTFGNGYFPEETHIIAHRITRDLIDSRFDFEKKFLLALVDDPAVYADAPKRLPDQVFDEFMELDLGGRIVQFHYFGLGCGPGDSIVYLPKEKVAWTGNLILGPTGIPWVIEGHAQEYLQTMARVIEALEIEVMIPGHGGVLAGKNRIRTHMLKFQTYLAELISETDRLKQSGVAYEDIVEAFPLPKKYLPPEELQKTTGGYPDALLEGWHAWNVLKTYVEP